MFKVPGVPSENKRRQAVVKRSSKSPKMPSEHKSVDPKPSLLDCVDNKVLKLIFRQVSSEDLKACKLVCKKFNEVVKKTFPGKAWLWLKNESFIDDIEVFDAMLAASREIVNFAVGESDQLSPVTCMHNMDDFFDDSWYFVRVQTVIGITYRYNINQVQLMNLEVSVTNLLRFLSFLGDLHTLKLFFVSQPQGKLETVKVPPDALPVIENIVVYECGLSVLKMLTYLQPDSVRSFTAKVTNFDNLDLALKKQNCVTKLSLNCSEVVPVPGNLFAGHEFTHLMLSVASFENLPVFLTQFKQTLQFLDIESSIDNETFAAITEMEDLKRLCANFSDVSGSVLFKITKLKKLSSLFLHAATSVHLEVLFSLEHFHLDFFDYPDCQPQETGLVQGLKQKINNDTGKIVCIESDKLT